MMISLLLSIGTATAGSVSHSNKTQDPAATFEGGCLYRFGQLNVVNLHGTYRQMGRQYGYLLREQLKGLYTIAIDQYFIKKKKVSPETIHHMARALFNFYPQRFKDIIYGMAETSGLTIEQHILLNGLELYGMISGCSGIAAWGEYTQGGPLIFGRNYDWFDGYTPFAKYLTLTVINPSSGIPCAIVTFAGAMYATTGINKKGVFLELNNGLPSGGGLTYSNRVPAIINLLAFLIDCSTMEELDGAFNSTRPDFSFIINVADDSCAYSYEWPPFDVRRRSAEVDGLLVATNHFVDPSWGMVLQEETGFKSTERRENLLSLGHKNKGRIDEGTMMNILDTPINEGGATWPEGETIQTVYQIIAIPSELRLCLKVPGFQNWTTVDLSDLFASK